jgi:hypothetical protein
MQPIIPQATNIKCENATGTSYKATINGTTWSGIHERSNMWASVQKAIADGATVEPFPTPTLADLKVVKIRAIDAKTATLIKSGFTYDGNLFSMSEKAQLNWAALAAAKANGILSYPMTVSTSTEGSYVIQDTNELSSFLLAYFMYQVDPNAPLAQGRVLKASVNACITGEELNAIIDNR